MTSEVKGVEGDTFDGQFLRVRMDCGVCLSVGIVFQNMQEGSLACIV